MMIIENSTLVNEVRSVFYDNVPAKQFFYTAYLEIQGEIIKAININGLHIVRDYNQSFADETILYLSFPLGTFLKRVYPHKENIQVTLLRATLTETGDATTSSGEVHTQVFRGILIDTGNKALEGNIAISTSEEEGNSKGIINVEFQLLNEALEYIRLKSTGGILRKTTPGSALKTLITNESINLPLAVENKILGVDMVEPDNNEVRDHIVIPHGTKVVDLANYIQKNCGGIYSTGIGFYLQNGFWFIYPEYNTQRFEKTREVIHIYNIPPRRLPHVERTYKKENQTVYILSTGEVKHFDDSESQQLNLGNGVRFTDPGKLFEEFGETKDNRTEIKRGNSNTEFKFSERETGLNNVQVSEDKYSSNIFYQTSKLARRKGQFVQVTWHNSLPELIKPGMPVRFYVDIDGEVEERDGVVIATEHIVTVPTAGPVVSKHSTNSAITLFLEKD